MAISPQEVCTLTGEEQESIRKLGSKFDAHLRQKFDGEEPVKIPLVGIKDQRAFVVKVAKEAVVGEALGQMATCTAEQEIEDALVPNADDDASLNVLKEKLGMKEQEATKTEG